MLIWGNGRTSAGAGVGSVQLGGAGVSKCTPHMQISKPGCKHSVFLWGFLWGFFFFLLNVAKSATRSLSSSQLKDSGKVNLN